VELVPAPSVGWKLKLSEGCAETLKQINEELGPHSRRYLARRIIQEGEQEGNKTEG